MPDFSADGKGIPWLMGATERWMQADPSQRDPYTNPQGEVVRNTPIDPRYGYRLQESPPLGVNETFYNVSHNWHPFEVARDAIKSIPDAPEALAFLASAQRGEQAGKMTPQQYLDTYGMSARTRKQYKDIGGDQIGGQPSLAEAELMRRKDADNYLRMTSVWGVYNPKNGNVSFDTNGFLRDLSQHPAEVGALFVGGEAGFAKAAEGVGKLAGLDNGLTFAQNFSRLKGAPWKGVAQDLAANTAKAAQNLGVQRALEVTGKGLGLTGKVLDPVTPLAAGVINKGVVAGANAVRRLPVLKASIYSPEFNREWGAFQKAEEQALIDSGMSPDQIKSIPTQRNMWEQFQQQTGNKFDNPFSAKANEAFDQLEAQGRGFRRENYAPPYIGKILDQTVNAKGKGITPAILAEGAIRSSAPEGGGLTGLATGQTPERIGITRSSATNEPPGILQQNEGIGSRNRFASNLEQTSRASTQSQLGEHLSDVLGGRTASPVTHQDIADDFIQTQLNKRNNYQQSYNNAVTAEGGGVYTDPNAFSARLDQEAAGLLKQRGIDPSELQSNADVFNGANSSIGNLRRNIGSHGAYVPPIEEVVGNTRYKLGDRNIWFDESGNAAPTTIQRALNSDPTIQAQINAPRPQPVNRLSLGNLEIERRNLSAAAEKAYQQGVENGDFRNYNAITAYRDALDNTAIAMANTHNGTNIDEAINHLKDARSQFRDWRQTSLDAPPTPANDVIREAAQRTFDLTKQDPATGKFMFSGEPDARSHVGNVFRGKLVGEDGVTPSYADPNSLADILTDQRRGLLSNPDTVQSHIRSGYARPGAAPEDLASYHATYAGRGVLNPEEQNFFDRSMAAQSATNPRTIPERDPFKLFPDLEEGMGKGRMVWERTKPILKGGLGYLAGTSIDPSGTLGWLAGSGAFGSNAARRAADDLGLFRNEHGGAPRYSVTLPEYAKARAPLGASEMANVATQSKQNAQDESLLAGMTATPATDEENKMLDALQGRAAGGRTAYKSGGKVADRSIEPLVQALMNKAKKAKKVSNKATEPLLNAHDDAIASALAVAQKSI